MNLDCGLHLWLITKRLCNGPSVMAGSQSLCRLFTKAELLTLMTVDFFPQSDALLIISSRALCSICTQRTRLLTKNLQLYGVGSKSGSKSVSTAEFSHTAAELN